MKFQLFMPIVIGGLLGGCSIGGINTNAPSHVYVYEGEPLNALDEAIVHASSREHCEDEFSFDCEFSTAYQYSLRPSVLPDSGSRSIFHLKPGKHKFELKYEEYMNITQTGFSPGSRTYVPGKRVGDGYWTDGMSTPYTYTRRTGYKKKTFPAYLTLKAAHEYHVVVQPQRNDWKPQQVCVVERPMGIKKPESSVTPQTASTTRFIYCRTAVGDYVGVQSERQSSGLGRYDKSRLEYVKD